MRLKVFFLRACGLRMALAFLAASSALAQTGTLPANLDSQLQSLVTAQANGSLSPQTLLSGPFVVDTQGRVKIRVTLKGDRTLQQVADELNAAGAQVEEVPKLPASLPGTRDLVAVAPVSKLVTIATLPGVQAVFVWRAPHLISPAPLRIMPAVDSPRVIYPGQAPSSAATPIGVTPIAATYQGTGQIVAVISDSYNTCAKCTKNATQDIASNNLPGVGNPAGNTSPMVVVGTDPPAGTDEGRAMLQLIYGLAPRAKLCFGSAGDSETAMAAQIIALAQPIASGGTCGATVIVDDIGFPLEPMFSDGIIAAAVNTVVGNGVPYLSSAGNVRGLLDTTWNAVSDATVRGGAFGNLKFGTVPSVLTAGGFQNFASTGQQISFSVTPVANKSFNPVLGWNDPFVAANITSDYNLLVFDANGNYLPAFSSVSVNTATGVPLETAAIPATTTATTYQIVISAATPPGAAQRLRIIPDRDMDLYTFTGITADGLPAIYGHPGALGAMGAAAYDYSILTTPESFSSGGPFTNYFDANNNRLVTPEVRQRPLIAGIDNDDTTFFGQDSDGNGFPNFSGTSAAAPTAAAVAALVMQAKAGLTPTQVSSYLAQSGSHASLWAAKDGFGYVNAQKAINAALASSTQLPSMTTLVSSRNPATIGTAVTLTATVSSGATTRSGYVDFFDGDTELGGSVVSSNTATLTTSGMSLNSNSLTAIYSGDSDDLESSATLSEMIDNPTFAVTGVPAIAHIGSSNNVTVSALDVVGDVDPDFTGTVTITSSDPAAALPATYTYTASDNGVHTFAITLNTSGTRTITATSGSTVGIQTGIYVDNALWLVNASGGTAARLGESGVAAFTTSAIGAPSSIAKFGFDSGGFGWFLNQNGTTLNKLSGTTGSVTGSYTGGGLATPSAMNIDGTGKIWIANSNGTISTFSNTGAALSPAGGYLASTPSRATPLNTPVSIVIDASGAVWLANNGNGTMTKVFGAASPTVTPVAAGATNNTIATEP
jgi:hypothetical protein